MVTVGILNVRKGKGFRVVVAVTSVGLSCGKGATSVAAGVVVKKEVGVEVIRGVGDGVQLAEGVRDCEGVIEGETVVVTVTDGVIVVGEGEREGCAVVVSVGVSVWVEVILAVGVCVSDVCWSNNNSIIAGLLLLSPISGL